MVIAESKIRGFDQDAIDSFYARHEEADDDALGLDEDDFRTKIANTKALFSAMQSANTCVTTFTRTYGAFYTLWSVISLHAPQLAAAEVLALRYAAAYAEGRGTRQTN